MHHQKHRDEQQAADDEDQREALETAEISGGSGNHDQGRSDEDAPQLREAEIPERQADADELGDDRQRIEQKKVDDTEGAPEFTEALEDQPGMPDPETAPSRSTIS